MSTYLIKSISAVRPRGRATILRRSNFPAYCFLLPAS